MMSYVETANNAKKMLLKEFEKEYREFFGEQKYVFGRGNVDSRIVLIGEAPGHNEVLKGEPFVGAAGKNLDSFMKALGIDRNELYITNAIKYRLSRINESTGREINRAATTQEIKSNVVWLQKEISILSPSLIVTMGNIPLKTVTGDVKNMNVSSVHGSLFNLRITGKNYQVFSLYHPASIIYNKNLIQVYNNDIILLKDIIDDFKKQKN